ncbi:MAG: DUF6051 family protein [Bacteroidales bacterium]
MNIATTSMTGLRIHTHRFRSRASRLLIDHDRSIEGNREFNVQVMKTDDGRPASSLILLLHGFNEKSWNKYMDWGKFLCRETGSAVLFFPIAFHMQRAPEKWSDRREMYRLSNWRRERYPDLSCSSLSNAAISERIQQHPQRLIRSGLASYYDVVQLLQECHDGHLKELRKDFSLKVFGYSIGGYLATLLKLSDPMGLFNSARTCLFCSGPVLKKFSPVSRYILDSEANRVLQEYLEKDLLNGLDEADPVIMRTFLSLLDYEVLPQVREELLRINSRDIYAIALEKDRVSPSGEVSRTLKGKDGETGIRVDAFDFPYTYTHENPFAGSSENNEIRDWAFREVFHRFSDFMQIR